MPTNRPCRRPAARGARRAARRAFTLIEIIVVVTIISPLPAMLAPLLLNRIGQAKSGVAKGEVATIAKEIQLYLLDNGLTRPPADMDLSVLTTGASASLKATDLLDPWGNQYVLVVPGEVNR